MGKTIQVTSGQVNAARLWIERADRDGTPVPESIRKLADAKPRPVLGGTLPTDKRPTSCQTGAPQPARNGYPLQPDEPEQ